MKYVILVSLLYSFIMSVSAQRIDKGKLVITYNSLRKELTNSTNELIEDTVLSEVLSIPEVSRQFGNQQSLDSIRRILREYSICDYNIKFVKYNNKDPYNLDIKEIKKKNKIFYKILRDTSYNRYGVLIENVNGEYSINLISTKRYLNFDIQKIGTIVDDMDGNIKSHIISIYGTSYFDPIFFSVSKELPSDTKVVVGQKVKLDTEKKFKIDVDITPGKKNENAKYIIVTDNKNNILSINNI